MKFGDLAVVGWSQGCIPLKNQPFFRLVDVTKDALVVVINPCAGTDDNDELSLVLTLDHLTEQLVFVKLWKASLTVVQSISEQ